MSLDYFDESVWLPVFKSTREHLGYFCPRHVDLVREEKMEARYLLSNAGPDEIIIDRLPLPPADSPADPPSAPSGASS